MTVINTNVKSLVAQDALSMNNRKLQTAMERLSTGSRINSAKDDAAGLAISTRMETQARGLAAAVKNANDGISLLQTAEGAMSEITDMLQRMRELALQAANTVNNDQDRAALDAEVQQLKAEIDRVASTTTFNDQKVLNGAFVGKQLQIGMAQNQTMSVDIKSVAASDIGRTALTNSSLATTKANATGKAAVVTVAQLAFFGDDSYTFKVAGVSVTGSVVANSPAAIVDNVNNALKAAGNTDITAHLVNGAVELRNALGGNIGVTDFTSVGNGKATFNVVAGGGTTTILDDTPVVQSSSAAVGSAASDTGVTLAMTASRGYSFKINGAAVSIGTGDAIAARATAIATALGAGYSVFQSTDVITTGAASGNFAAAAGYAAGVAGANTYSTGVTTFGTALASGGFNLGANDLIIWSGTSNVPINITEFAATDTVAAGVKGTIRAAGGNSEAILVDGTNKFTVNESTTAGTPTEVSLAFTSTTSDYDVNIDGKTFTVTAADLQAGTAATTLISAINAVAAATMNQVADTSTATTAAGGGGTQDFVAAGGLASLGNTIAATTSGATKVTYEIVQNGSTLSIKKLDNYADLVVKIDATNSGGVRATAGTAAGAASFTTNNPASGTPDAGTTVDLNATGAATFQTSAATPTKMTMEFSGDATYTFALTNLAGTGQFATVVNAAMVGGSTAALVASVNNLTASTGITAAADPNNSKAIILSRSDGKKIQVTGFTSTGNATALATPSAGQGAAKLLSDDANSVQASATAAGAATSTVAKMTFSGTTLGTSDKVSFKLYDGRSTAVVRATNSFSGAAQGDDLLAEINSAIANAGLDIVATKAVAGSQTEITFTAAKGNLVEVSGFVSDGTGTATFAPSTGQGVAVILDDNGGVSSSGKAIADINVNTISASNEGVGVIDNAMQQISNNRATLGALQNRLIHTVENLTNIRTNTLESRSRILDADYAQETAELARAQIIQQAATAMLAQANQSNMSVLSLLQ